MFIVLCSLILILLALFSHSFSSSLGHCCSLPLSETVLRVTLYQKSQNSSGRCFGLINYCLWQLDTNDKFRSTVILFPPNTVMAVIVTSSLFSESFALAGAPLAVWRRMERGGGSPVPRDSPEIRGDSPDLGNLPPPGKKSRLEINGSPTGPRIRHNGAPSRPQGGKVQKRSKHELSTKLYRFDWGRKVSVIFPSNCDT